MQICIAEASISAISPASYRRQTSGINQSDKAIHMPECDSTSDGPRLRISGRQLAFCRMGSESPTVIFETGLGAESGEWLPIQKSIASTTLTFRYDRVGRGRSDPADHIRTAEDMVGDLRSLLRVAGVPGP